MTIIYGDSINSDGRRHTQNPETATRIMKPEASHIGSTMPRRFSARNRHTVKLNARDRRPYVQRRRHRRGGQGDSQG